MTVDVALDCRCALGEGPVWDARIGRLLFVDIDGHQVHAFDPSTGADDTRDAGEFVSAIALASAGGHVVTLQHRFARVDLPAGRLEPIAGLPEEDPGIRFNDGYVDPRGRFWAGTLSLTKQPRQAALYRLERATTGRAARIIEVLTGVTTSNGIDWSSDGRLMYYVDTGTRRIDVFDFDADTGALAHRRAVVTFADGEGRPDGLILDEEGCLWVALWQGSAVRRYSPDGRMVQQIDLPVSCPTKCAFGGPGLDDLYITSARSGLSPAGRALEPHAGNLFIARPGVRGRPVTPVE